MSKKRKSKILIWTPPPSTLNHTMSDFIPSVIHPTKPDLISALAPKFAVGTCICSAQIFHSSCNFGPSVFARDLILA